MGRLEEKEQRLMSRLSMAGSLIVAYSGGVDSSVLAYYARCVLKDKAKIVIAVSPSLAKEELDAARAQAAQFDWDLVEIPTGEVEQVEYQRNDAMRCYFCKSTLFASLEELKERFAVNHIAYGANIDDRKDFRPGHRAAREHNVLSPLQDAELTKDEIRQLAKRAGLPSWDRPQAACLSSRFPTFEPVSAERLHQVDRAEQVLHVLGFKQVRVRHHGDLARIEVAPDKIPLLVENAQVMEHITGELQKLGYRYVTLDLLGYRQGSANRPMPSAALLSESDGSTKTEIAP